MIDSIFDPRFYIRHPLDDMDASQYLKNKEYPLLDKWYNQQLAEMIQQRYLALLITHYKVLEVYQPTAKKLLNIQFIREIEKIRSEKELILKLLKYSV